MTEEMKCNVHRIHPYLSFELGEEKDHEESEHFPSERERERGHKDNKHNTLVQ